MTRNYDFCYKFALEDVIFILKNEIFAERITNFKLAITILRNRTFFWNS